MKVLKPNFWKNNNFIVLFLWPLTLITRIIILIKKLQNKYQSRIPSICIGNIYIGGTGKTQLVLKINNILKKKYRTFVIKKKYINQSDEQKLLRKKTKLILPKNRVDGIKQIENIKKSVAIFDDGLQDRFLEYTISIVCFSSFSGIGNGKLIPAGPLREDLSALKKYNVVFINGKKNSYLTKKIKEQNKKIKIFSGKYILKNKKDFNINTKYLAFCGIGTPENFFDFLKENKVQIKNKVIFPDHYNYEYSDIERIKNIAKKDNLKIITTEKDYMKVKKFKNIKVKFTEVDLHIYKYLEFKKYLMKSL